MSTPTEQRPLPETQRSRPGDRNWWPQLDSKLSKKNVLRFMVPLKMSLEIYEISESFADVVTFANVCKSATAPRDIDLRIKRDTLPLLVATKRYHPQSISFITLQHLTQFDTSNLNLRKISILILTPEDGMPGIFSRGAPPRIPSLLLFSDSPLELEECSSRSKWLHLPPKFFGVKNSEKYRKNHPPIDGLKRKTKQKSDNVFLMDFLDTWHDKVPVSKLLSPSALC